MQWQKVPNISLRCRNLQECQHLRTKPVYGTTDERVFCTACAVTEGHVVQQGSLKISREILISKALLTLLLTAFDMIQ